jgi:hypothetical protein
VNKLSRQDKRFIYTELPKESQSTGTKLQVNLGKRRNYAMQNYIAQRYIFIDADTEMFNRNYIAQLLIADRILEKDIIMTQTMYKGRILPKLPLDIGTMDMTNITFSRNIAEMGQFPTDVVKSYGPITDYRFFLIINKPHNTSFMPILGCIKDARRSYESVREFFARTR